MGDKQSERDRPDKSAGVHQIEVTPEMIRAGVAEDRRWSWKERGADEEGRIRSVFAEMMKVQLAGKSR